MLVHIQRHKHNTNAPSIRTYRQWHLLTLFVSFEHTRASFVLRNAKAHFQCLSPVCVHKHWKLLLWNAISPIWWSSKFCIIFLQIRYCFCCVDSIAVESIHAEQNKMERKIQRRNYLLLRCSWTVVDRIILIVFGHWNRWRSTIDWIDIAAAAATFY